jgi:hypothetical protein
MATIGPVMTWDRAPVHIRLDGRFADVPSVVTRLNGSGGLVAAHAAGDIVVVRPLRQPSVAGMPVYYDGRPEFRGKLRPEGNGGVVLSGYVQRSGLPVLFNLGAGLVAAFGAMFGASMLLSGDLTGVVVILAAALTGAIAITGAVLFGRLSRMDEQTILAALRAAEEEPEAGTAQPR